MQETAFVLHGGGGPATVAPLVSHLADTFIVDAPVHPGWSDTASVADDTIRDLSRRYLDALAAQGTRDVVLIGSSLGGWIATEMAIQDAERENTERIIGRLVLIDTVGFSIPGEPIRDFFALDARGVAEYSWADPERGYIDPASRTPAELATLRGNLESLRQYAADPYMHDPTLRARAGAISIPALVLWGDSDRIVTPAYGQAVAGSIPGAAFRLIRSAGHLPHLEQPGATRTALDHFLTTSAPHGH
jgi:pimeloyl-ACP methyl ester carboxylesterase